MDEPEKSLKIEENVPLAPLTTLKIGGAARFFVRAETENQVAEAFAFAGEHGFDLFVLGGGSNVLIADEGFDGLVLTAKGQPVAIQMTHVWVRALIPYIPNRGATAGTLAFPLP